MNTNTGVKRSLNRTAREYTPQKIRKTEEHPPQKIRESKPADFNPRSIGHVHNVLRAQSPNGSSAEFSPSSISCAKPRQASNLNNLFERNPGGTGLALTELQGFSIAHRPIGSASARIKSKIGKIPLPVLPGSGNPPSPSGSAGAAANADSSIGSAPAFSQFPTTPIFTPPGTPTRPASTHVGQCKGMGYVTDDGRWFIKPAYKNPDMKELRTPGSFFKKSVTNAFYELTWMQIIKLFLEKNPISIQVQGITYPVHVVPTELTDTFEFKQTNIKKDSMTKELKKEMSGQMLKVMLPKLWNKGLITALDIKPDNFHVSENQIHIFDLYFPKDLFDSIEDLKIQIHSHCKTHTKLPKNEYEALTTDLFKNHFNLDAARQVAKASKATCDELIETHKGLKHYSESVLELAHPPTIVVDEYGFLGHLAYALFSQTK